MYFQDKSKTSSNENESNKEDIYFFRYAFPKKDFSPDFSFLRGLSKITQERVYNKNLHKYIICTNVCTLSPYVQI